MSDTAPLPASRSDNTGGWLAALLIAATFFIAGAPTLSWLEFASGMENLNASTVLEIHRNGRWLVPTLEGEPRTAKPPFPTWISAITVRAQTFRDLDSPEPAIRRAAYDALAWQIRWPALLSSCVMLLAIFHLGRTIGGTWSGLLAMAVAGSTIYFFRYSKQATTDVQLALWIAIAMAAIGRICLVRLTWTASIVAGVALGLALMSKGPVALLQSLAPAVVFVLLFRRRLRILPILVGLVIMLIVGGAWYAWVAIEVPTVWERWRIELTRASPVEKTGNPLGYFSLFAFMMPWSVVLIHGIIWTAVEAIDIARGRLDRAGREGWVLALLLLFVPIVVMSFFPDRKDRYLLPLLTPASIIAARGLSAMLDANDKRRVPPIVQWLILLVIAIGLPLFGVYGIKRTDGTPWWTLQFAVLSSAVLVVVIGIASAAARKWPLALVGASVAVMLLIQPIFYRGYRFAREGRAELRPLAELLRREFPDVEPFYVRPLGHRRVPSDFSIYLNRIAPWVADPSHIKPASVPQAYVIVQRPNEPEPEPAPGWYYLAKVKKDADWYHTFVRLPSNDTTNEAATQNAQ